MEDMVVLAGIACVGLLPIGLFAMMLFMRLHHNND
jgi:hypothetical protein